MADQDDQPDQYEDAVEEHDDGSATVTIPDEISDIEEQPDGSAIVHMEFKGPDEDQDFYANMAEEVAGYDLSQIAMRYMDDIDRDRQAREERDKQYEEGLKRTGLGNDAPGGANFMGASKVVHPVMAEACVDFAARAIKELFPPDGPVRTKILGESSDIKEERANNKRDFVNWQLTEQIEEFRDGFLPGAGQESRLGRQDPPSTVPSSGGSGIHDPSARPTSRRRLRPIGPTQHESSGDERHQGRRCCRSS